MHHFNENAIAYPALILCSAFVFPLPTFISFVLGTLTGRVSALYTRRYV